MNAIEEVMAVEREWVQAHRVVDVATIRRLMADDYVRTNADGSIARRSEVLSSHESGKRSWEHAAAGDYDVPGHGETAIVLGRWTARGINDGNRFDCFSSFPSSWNATARFPAFGSFPSFHGPRRADQMTPILGE